MTDLADRVPDSIRRFAQRAVYAVDPRYSWTARRRMDAVDERFVERFFDDRAEYEAYEREFFDGRIVDVCRAAAPEMPDDATIFDAHRGPCAKLYALIRKREPGTVVETGVYNGVATLSALLALDRNDAGTLHSVDYSRHLQAARARHDAASAAAANGETTTGVVATDGERAEGTAADGGVGRRAVLDAAAGHYERGRPSCAEARSTVLPPGEEPGWIVPGDLRDRWELTVGDSRRELPALLPAVGPVDLFVHDSELSTVRMVFEFELAWEYLVDGGLLLSNHVAHNDAFETFAAERDCEHGLFDYLYDVRYDDYDEPCSSGYLVKS